MRRGILVAVIGALVVMPIVVFLVARSRRPAGAAATGRVSYAQVQTIFNASCVGCHPSVNPSLDLTAGHSYGALVNTRALEDPNYVRVAVGDPEKSFLYLKVAGFGQAAQIGGRMPLRANPLPTADVRLIADWIREGARGPASRTCPTWPRRRRRLGRARSPAPSSTRPETRSPARWSRSSSAAPTSPAARSTTGWR
jgi:hypothetical protein